MFFAYGFGNSITFPFSAGAATLLLPGQPKPAAIFEAIERFRPSVFFGLPTLYTSLTKAEGAEQADFSSLRMALSAAEVLSADVFNGWKKLTGLEIVEGLGSTEVLHIYLSNRPERRNSAPPDFACPATRSCSGTRTAARSATTRKAFCGCAAIPTRRCTGTGPTRPPRPSATAGWIYTGDRFVRDSDGFHFFRGRADDLIKISGQWVYPLEVELCLAEHPDVRECAVFAAELPDRRMTLKAVVVMNNGAFDEGDATKMLQDFVKAKLLPYKYPRESEIHRRIAEDRHRQDRPTGGDADLGTPQLSSREESHKLSRRCPGWSLALRLTRTTREFCLALQSRPAVQPRQIAIVILGTLRPHDRVADPRVVA